MLLQKMNGVEKAKYDMDWFQSVQVEFMKVESTAFAHLLTKENQRQKDWIFA